MMPSTETRRELRVIAENKDHEAEEWILKRVEDQRDDPNVCFRRRGAQPASHTRQPQQADIIAAKDNRRRREVGLRRRIRRLSLENRKLKRELAEIKGSTTWGLLDTLNRLVRTSLSKIR
jgi:hypothetical protein